MERSLYQWQTEALDLFMQKKQLVVNVATGCLSGDTLIDLPRNLSEYPGGIPIRELCGKQDFYVYSFNTESNKLELKKCRDVWFSGYKEVYEIITLGGKSIMATKNHKFLTDIRKNNSTNNLTKNRKYVELEQLKVGDYLTTFNRSKWLSNKNYNLIRVDYNIQSRNKGGKIEEHKFIAQQLCWKIKESDIIHHLDGNKNNNEINNLRALSHNEHARMHTFNRGLFGKEIWPNGEHPRGNLGNKGYIYGEAKNKVSDFSFNEFKTEEHARKSGELSRIGLSKLDKEFMSQKNSKNGQIKYFDKIISINYKCRMDTYDMEVEDNHNFIANGIITHNCGKTTYAIECIKKIRELDPDVNILIVSPKIVILETVWLKELYNAGLGPNLVGVYYGYAHEFSKITLTTIASIPRLDMGVFDVIICDEIHNMMSPPLLKLLKHKFEYKLGLSASIKHIDQRHWKLLEYFKYNTYDYGMKQAIKDGIINKFNFHLIGVVISDPEVRQLYDEVDDQLSQMLQAYGGFERVMKLSAEDPSKQAILQLFTKRNDIVNNYVKKVDVVKNIISEHPEHKTLLFSQYNKITTQIYWALKDVSIKSEKIDTSIKQSLRDKFLKQFEEGEYNILLSSRIFEEGYNLPRIETAIFLSSNSTSRQMIQRLGRILRKKEKISDAYYIYCVDTFEEDYAGRAKEFVQDVAEQVFEVKY